jgi:hypothetical protein
MLCTVCGYVYNLRPQFHAPSSNSVAAMVDEMVFFFQDLYYTKLRAGIAQSGYGMHRRGSIPGKGKIFLFSRPDLGLTHPPIQLVPGAVSPG